MHIIADNIFNNKDSLSEGHLINCPLKSLLGIQMNCATK